VRCKALSCQVSSRSHQLRPRQAAKASVHLQGKRQPQTAFVICKLCVTNHSFRDSCAATSSRRQHGTAVQTIAAGAAPAVPTLSGCCDAMMSSLLASNLTARAYTIKAICIVVDATLCLPACLPLPVSGAAFAIRPRNSDWQVNCCQYHPLFAYLCQPLHLPRNCNGQRAKQRRIRWQTWHSHSSSGGGGSSTQRYCDTI
jgi:hypothetical protein